MNAIHYSARRWPRVTTVAACGKRAVPLTTYVEVVNCEACKQTEVWKAAATVMLLTDPAPEL